MSEPQAVGPEGGSRKRKRRPVSCWHCRIRKVKCNRETPCESCVKAGDAATCSYVSQGPHKSSGLPQDSAQENGLEARIDRLESLLMSVAANERQSLQLHPNESTARQDLQSSTRRTKASSSASDANDDGHMINEVSRALGVMKVDDDHERSHYLGASHWVAIGLSEIAEFRTYLKDNYKQWEQDAFDKRALVEATPVNTMSLLRGTTPPVSKEEVLSWVPPRVIVDELITRYFESHNPTVALVHLPTFREEYTQFWLDPYAASFQWLALFFAILRLAEILKEIEDISAYISPDHFDLVALYKRLTIQCLLAADYTKPTTYTIRAIFFYVESEWLTTQDSAIEVSLILALAVRLAMGMGIHREWKEHPDLTPFQAEMRRRLWTGLYCMDIMYSFQLSLPSTVRQGDCDCASPKNIRDEDFGKNSASLPSSRPTTEITKVSYMIAKKQLVSVLDRILKATEHKGDIPREEVRKLEDAMLSSRNAIPPPLQVTLATETAPASTLIKKQRLQLDRLCQLAPCILYRRYLCLAHQDEKLMHFRRSCIDAALCLLNHQADLYLAWGAGVGSPVSIQKRHIFTLTSHDFYIAGIAIAIDLHYGLKAEPEAPKASDVRLWGFDRRPEMIHALERSTEYWRIAKSDSIEAAKAWGLFSFSVDKAKKILSNDSTDQSLNEQNTSGPLGPLSQNDALPIKDYQSIQSGPEFDWDLWNDWNAYAGNDADFESLLQWMPDGTSTNGLRDGVTIP